jgi:Raf kinase inhibitor-like YbhB/YbcL family protein
MLENIPSWLGRALRNLRAGHDALTLAKLDLAEVETLQLRSSAFEPDGRIPERFTSDGAGISPPLYWSGVPSSAESLALIVEDPDAPTPSPLVHAIVVDINRNLCGLDEGAIRADGIGRSGKNVGKNSYLSEGWLPPDPPSGHGEHDYVFQLLALGPGPSEDRPSPGRASFVEHVRGRILAAGVLVGTYSRGEPSEVGPIGDAVPAA